jgi:hypothetical protein
MTGRTVMRGNSEMTEDTPLRARLHATVRERGLRCLSSAHVSLLQLVAEDAGHLRQQSERDSLALLREEDTKNSLRLVTAAHRAVVFLLGESAHPWLAV